MPPLYVRQTIPTWGTLSIFKSETEFNLREPELELENRKIKRLKRLGSIRPEPDRYFAVDPAIPTARKQRALPFNHERYCSHLRRTAMRSTGSPTLQRWKELAMTGVPNQRALLRAQQILALAQPLPQDVNATELRELASRYIDEAERREREDGQAVESVELVSAALDNIAKDYFAWAVRKAREQQRRAEK
jgi:hypothetical protein